MKSGEGLKISVKAFLLSLCWVTVLSLICYFLLLPLCKRFVPFLKPFVLLISIAFFVALFYICVSYFKTFFAEIRANELAVSKGFLVSRKEKLNLKYTVSVKRFTTPVMRLLGLSNLLLIFEGSVCFLPLLKNTDTEEILSFVSKLRDENETL